MEISPLNLRKTSDKLASCQYPTPYHFRLDIVAMFAMHRIVRTNEKNFSTDSTVECLLDNGWYNPLIASFSSLVAQLEARMRWLF